MGRHFGPTQQLKDYHVSVARGGVGMTTLAYAAVCRSGLSFDKQLWLRPEIVPGLRDITDAVHREGAAAGIQIGHCGNMTHLTTAGQIPIGASTGFNLYAYTPVRGMRAGEIEQVACDFGRAVHTAHDAGFDSVEVHAGHGYLISQFLSPLHQPPPRRVRRIARKPHAFHADVSGGGHGSRGADRNGRVGEAQHVRRIQGRHRDPRKSRNRPRDRAFRRGRHRAVGRIRVEGP